MMEKHDAPDSQHAQERMVLPPVVQYGALLRDCKVNGKWRRCLAPVVDRSRIWIKDYLPSGIPGTPAPIDVIAIHEQVFIEQSDLIKSFSTNHRETAHNDIYSERAVMREVEHVLAGEKTAPFEYAFQAGRRTKVVP